jgi:hypothetical protein
MTSPSRLIASASASTRFGGLAALAQKLDSGCVLDHKLARHSLP